uniref:Uncharacterized protein n=1 Tax=Lotharella globosa TaxID=91324 RepID=A0A6V3JY60_9EUKA
MYYFVYVAIDDNMMHGPAEYIKRGYVLRISRTGSHERRNDAMIGTKHIVMWDLGRLKLHRENFREDAKAAAMFWIPVHWLNFKMVPLHLRMPFMGLIGCEQQQTS